MKGWCAVQQHWVLAYHIIQNRPDFGSLLLDKGLGFLDIVDHAFLDKLLHDEGLVEFQRHLGGKPALVEPEFGADDDY